MVESINRPTKKRRGFFYVRNRMMMTMRLLLLHSKQHGIGIGIGSGRQQPVAAAEKKTFSYRLFFKWLLCLSLSFYFFTSNYFINTNTNTNTNTNPVSKTILPSRPLFQSSLHTTPPKQTTTHHQGSFIYPSSRLLFKKDLKVYIYDLPSKYNSDWLSNERCSNHLFAAEVAIHRALLNDDDGDDHVRTLNPWDADFFFVPVYVSCNFSTVNGFPAIGHARPLLASAVHLISSDLPFWNRSRGSDHIFVASHDYGPCFHTMENVAIADGIPEFLRNSIILQTFGVRFRHPCQDVENVVIPPYVSPEKVKSTLQEFPVNGRRDIFAYFRGKMEVHPKNISGRFYSKRVRTIIWQRYSGDRRFYLKRQRFAGYQSEIARSVFCLCPLGWAPWSPRLVESVVLGCVPVIIADGIRLPFPAVVPWSEISLTVSENDVGELGAILEHVAATNLSTIQRNLWDPAVKRALLFYDQMQEGDATWQVLDALAHKLSRSHRTSRLSGEFTSDTW